MKLTDASLAKLATCHPDLRRVVMHAAKTHDFFVVCGWRGEKDQNLAYDQKRSQVRWPDGKHNRLDEDGVPLSDAVDLVPFDPLTGRTLWEIGPHWGELAAGMFAAASICRVEIAWGGDWPQFKDLPHFQRHEHSTGVR